MPSAWGCLLIAVIICMFKENEISHAITCRFARFSPPPVDTCIFDKSKTSCIPSDLVDGLFACKSWRFTQCDVYSRTSDL